MTTLNIARMSIKQSLALIGIAVVIALSAVIGISYSAIVESKKASAVADSRATQSPKYCCPREVGQVHGNPIASGEFVAIGACIISSDQSNC